MRSVFKRKRKTIIYWIQGIPGSGKTTLATAIWNKLRKWGDTGALLDDQILMHIDPKGLRDIVKVLSRRYPFVIICSVSRPTLEVSCHTLLEASVKTVAKRHGKHDNVGFQEVEYERYWEPRCAQARPDVTIRVGKKTPQAIYGEFYNKVLKYDLE